MRKIQLFTIFVITLSVTLSIGFMNVSAQEDGATFAEPKTIFSKQDTADGFDSNQMAFVIPPGDIEFSGSITFEASVPVDVVVFGKDPGHTVWTLDHKNFFGFNVIDSEVTNGKSFFTGYGLAFLEPLNEKFEVTYTLELDSDENQLIDSEVEELETEIIEDTILPPLQQIKSGINYENVQCKDSHTLIFKTNERPPACVSLGTAFKLLSSGWSSTGVSTEIENVESTPQEAESESQNIESTPQSEESIVLDRAKDFVISYPTFYSDGIPESLFFEIIEITDSTPPLYVVEAKFSNLHSGYGAREVIGLKEEITQHTMELIIEHDGSIVSAIIDEKFDEQFQYMLNE